MLDKMVVFVDLQGFKTLNNNFIPKEIAILKIGSFSQRFTIKPPYPIDILPNHLKYQTKWLQRHIHGFDWHAGNDSLQSVQNFMINNNIHNCNIYVKGSEKKSWMLQLFKFIEPTSIINIEDFGCSKLLDLRHSYSNIKSCGTHYGNCAWQNCYMLQQWYQEEEDKISEI